MSSSLSRKQKKKDQKKEKKNEELKKNKLHKMTEIEKEALFHSQKTVIDESVRAKHTDSKFLVDASVINEIVANSSESANLESDNFDTKNLELNNSDTKKLESNISEKSYSDSLTNSLNSSEIVNKHHKMINFSENMEKEYEKKKHELMILWCVIAIFAVLLAVMLFVDNAKTNNLLQNERMIEALSIQLDTEKSNSMETQTKLDESNSKVEALSEVMAIKVDELANAQDELRMNRIPNAYPLNGNAAIVISDDATSVSLNEGDLINVNDLNANDLNTDEEDNTDLIEDESLSLNTTDEFYDEMEAETQLNDETIIDMEYKDKAYALFNVQSTAKVLATGQGKVVAIQEDPEFGYAIKIDHENGYYTIYRAYGIPLAAEGDQVSKGCIIMRIDNDNTQFVYQVIYENSYMNPMDIMEING